MMPYMNGTGYAAYAQAAPLDVYTQNYAQNYTQNFSQNDALLESLSQQLASNTSSLRRRHSRGATISQRTPGAPMRIVKPSSANNSPRSVMQARRGTLTNDDMSFMAPQQPTMIDQSYYYTNQQQQQQYAPRRIANASTRPARPVSWHPGSNLAVPNQFSLPTAAQFQMEAYGASASTIDMEPFPCMQPFTISPAAYSSQTSPSTTFSPYLGAFDNTAAGQYYSPNPWALSPSINTNGAMFDKLPSPVECPALVPASVASQGPADVYAQPPSQQSVEFSTCWNMLATQAPPTPPDSCFAALKPAEAPIEEDETDGEVLIGMGLYDIPDKEVMDPTLESYRSSMSHLLATSHKYPEPTGKGLKLEDAWEPPENMDDADNDDDDEEDDAEGEEQ